MKQCSKCKVEKALDQFHKSNQTSDGLHGHCKQCRSKRKPITNNNKQTMWAYKVRNKYGLTIEQYNEMRDSFQSCSICGYSEKLVLDHNHRTGQLREFICSNCNLALGLLNEDPERMERMIAYVRKHEREEIK